MNEWGYYTVGDCPTIITPEQFRALTGGKLSSKPETVKAMLEAVSSAARGYCGWHISPELECVYQGEADGGIVRLPAMAVTDVLRVEVNGREVDPSTYEWTKVGLVKLHCNCCAERWNSTRVYFTAGVDAAGGLAAVVAQIASNALVAPAGIASEHAGQVGLTYNQTSSGVSGGVSLLSRDMALLSPWRLREV